MKKIAVIGVGAMGVNHIRILHDLKTVTLAAICDIDEERGKALAKKCHTTFYKNYKDLLRDKTLFGIIIAVPTKLHKKIALACLEKGIHILLEKPIASTVKDAQEIIKKAKEKKIVLVVGHVERFNPAVVRLEKLIKTGVLGDILSVVVKRVGLNPPPTHDVNVVTDLAIHDLDIVTSVLKRMPKAVFARGGAMASSIIEDHAEIFLDYEKFGCFIQANWITPVKIRTLSITGTKGHAELNYISQELSIYKRQEHTNNKNGGFKQFVKSYKDPKQITVVVKKGEPLKNEILYFLKQAQKSVPMTFTPEDALSALKLSEAVNKSIKKRSLVYI